MFRNDPVVVADAFKQPLQDTFSGAFAEVVFAIGAEQGANYDAFAQAFA